MERNVKSFLKAIREGFNPSEYTYDPAKIPVGEMDATLDCKIWSNGIIGINCYFTRNTDNSKFVLTVFYDKRRDAYKLPGNDIDFTTCAINQSYYISVVNAVNNRVRLISAAFIRDTPDK